jgi:hypothetical protein
MVGKAGAARCSTESVRSSPLRRRQVGVAPNVELGRAAQGLAGTNAAGALLGRRWRNVAAAHADKRAAGQVDGVSTLRNVTGHVGFAHLKDLKARDGDTLAMSGDALSVNRFFGLRAVFGL